ncbi:MAG: hypothetical protein DMG32_23070 [Acidobacteria bacterium]|nr:MAG: hypothetical protein DMG32_23070 [Acidobacteriota bacterium]
MSAKAKWLKVLTSAGLATLAFQCAGAQTGQAKATVVTPDVARTIKAAADALGMPRTGGPGGALLPEIDVVNRMEILGTGSSSASGQTSKTEYHAALGYNPPAMRLEMTRTNPGGTPQHTIQTVRDNYAWDESAIGAGLEPGRGTATPKIAAVKDRLLHLWVLPYGVVKAAFVAGDKTTVSIEDGATVLTVPLSGELAGVRLKATLDSKNFITKVVAQTGGGMDIEADYSDYADHGEILTDVKSPGHIVEKRGGSTVLDIQVKTWDANNPYLVFPVPPDVKKAAAQESSKVAEK